MKNYLTVSALFFFFASAALTVKAAPLIEIISPPENIITQNYTPEVRVHFAANANPKKGKTTGNVKTILLKVNDAEVARYSNPPQIKEGDTVFDIDLSTYGDGVHTIQACAFQGNEKSEHINCSETHSYTLDREAPTVTATIAPQINQAGWHNSDITVSFHAVDTLSEIIAVTPDILINAEGKNIPVTGSAEDAAGNIGTATFYVNLDKTV
ncbi:MAG: hypothetical protein D3923_06935, partial [Candidatus Electrothrix sp. AR3]|nr:hypothetical protein [Candidatus Electrothrix sp. AR3]